MGEAGSRIAVAVDGKRWHFAHKEERMSPSGTQSKLCLLATDIYSTSQYMARVGRSLRHIKAVTQYPCPSAHLPPML